MTVGNVCKSAVIPTIVCNYLGHSIHSEIEWLGT